MSPKRILGFLLIASMTVTFAACDDTKTVAPPDPDEQITTVRHYTTALEDGRQIGLQNDDVYDVYVASDGKLWVGNKDGVAIFGDPGSTRRSDAYDQNNGLPNPKVRSIVESDGILYVGTSGGGVGAYDMTAGTWKVINTSNGLVNDLIADMKVDDDGAIIIATHAGVSRYNPATGAIVNYIRQASATVVGDLLDEYVSAVEIAHTPRGKEYWYMPRWESGILPEDRNKHGITITRGKFNAPLTIDTLRAAIDNTLYENVNGALSNGAGEFLVSGVGTDGLMRRCLLKFNVDGVVPSDATVLSARLRLRNLTAGFRVANTTLQRVLADWGEGTSDATGTELTGAPSTAGDATWKHRIFPNSNWGTLGGDFDTKNSSSLQIRGPGAITMTGLQMTADVQAWAKATTPNYGWILVNPDSLKRFSSRENPTVANRPTLEVSHSRYTYVTQVSSAFPDPNVNDIYYDELNDLFYIAFSTKGLAVVDVATARWTMITTDQGLPSNVVYSIAQVGGVIWVGTQNGLARQKADGSFQGYGRSGGLPGDRVRRVYSDRPDRLWLGFASAGAAWVNPESAE